MSPKTPSLRLLVVDDDDEFRESLALLLKMRRHEVVQAASLAAAREALENATFDAVLVDEELPDGRGSELLNLPKRAPMPEVIVITGHGSVSLAVDLMRRGAADFITKPADPEILDATLSRLGRLRALRMEVDGLRAELRDRGRFGPLVGRSESMQPVFEMIQRVAPTEASVLIQGESGTGKELVARALHDLSQRSAAPMVPVNCGAIPESLIESELFGHQKGSFTGAIRDHRGFFERADGGTLFLDEITEMPPGLQVKLLRVLETGLVQRVGGSDPIQTDVRVLAATNRDPETAIRDGKLREDLYFRLAVFPIRVPPLRERATDLELLAQHFLDELNRVHATEKRWAPDALAKLAQREWRGNVRELRNAVQRAFILTDDQLRAEEAVVGVTRPAAQGANDGELTLQVGASIEEAERMLIKATLDSVGGNKPQAASILGISLKTLYARLRVYEAAGR